jgi:hypothetical protein
MASCAGLFISILWYQKFKKISVEFTLENKIKFSRIFPILLSEQWQTLPDKWNKILSNSCVARQHSQTFGKLHRRRGCFKVTERQIDFYWDCNTPPRADLAIMHTCTGNEQSRVVFLFNFIKSKIWWTFPKKLANLCFSKFFHVLIGSDEKKKKQSLLEKKKLVQQSALCQILLLV